MDHTEQFIRLNCSLLSDYKMMKLEADMFWKKFHFHAAAPVKIRTGTIKTIAGLKERGMGPPGRRTISTCDKI